ncbi:Gfo/Idh/MocA family protein [Cohnella cellulosilytica]|uniref:Gfo/Idh/MocA family protein n=1 Tax=Cohnella cellulosilytica TaxID=986710 RepID=A0ABW2FF46_9BACL
MIKRKAAVIGCGGAGSQHAGGYVKLPGVEFVGAADIDLSKAEALTAQTGGRAYASYEELIAAEKPDFVSVCTREYDHEQPALFALEHGCHVLSEKLMAHSLDAGRAMLNTARKHNRLLGVNYNYRFIDSIRLLKEKLDSGVIGEIKTASFQVHAYCHHHALDLIRYLFGDMDGLNATLTEIDSERHYPWNLAHEMLYIPSYNEATVLRAGKTLVTLTASHRSFAFPLMEVEVTGAKGRILIRDMNVDSINGEMRVQLENQDERFLPGPLTLEHTFHRSIDNWVKRLNGLETDSASGEDGLQALLLESAIARSNRERSDVNLRSE